MKTVTILAIAALAGTAVAQPTDYIDVGVIGGEGHYAFTTDGSFMDSSGLDMDTELGLWDASGTLLGQDDDGSSGLWSLVEADLTAGVYWLGISEFNSDFVDGWGNTGTMFEDGEYGNCVLNVNAVFAASKYAGGTGSGYDQNAYFKVTVTPAPGALALLGLGGLVARRRR